MSLASLEQLLTQLDAEGCNVSACKRALVEANQTLLQHYHDGALAPELIRLQSSFTDQLLCRLWQTHLSEADSKTLCLVAVGGYGRAELHPRSDIDILVLTDSSFSDSDGSISAFITAMWDVGMDVGHSVRDVERCIEEARADLSTITNLLECRFVIGNQSLYNQLNRQLHRGDVWTERDFFDAKRAELEERHSKHRDAAYRLEPNLKESPGGLRDVHCIEWLLIRRHGSSDLTALVEDNYLSEDELDELLAARNHLWRIRFVLHHLSTRKEDRLLFDHQRNLASAFGFPEVAGNDSVEKFMQQYYRTVTELERLIEMVIQLMATELLPEAAKPSTPTDNKRFVMRNRYIEVISDDVFQRYPPAILELFQVYAVVPEARGIGAETLRLLRSSLELITPRFRSDMIVRDLFTRVVCESDKYTRKLRLMNRYGVLARYLPEFEKIVGRMQYDLFHIYTVDEHTLMVVRNLRRFALQRFSDEFPHCSEVMQQVEKPEILYLTALFHDIAKGRDGDHSVLGAEDAQKFCEVHGLTAADTRIMVWAVRYHLTMSMTAQHKDISDPAVVTEFARLTGTIHYLNFLYLLTVADIRGTNPEMWNSWKANLLRQLYESTYKALLRGLDNPVDKEEIIAEKKQRVLDLVLADGLSQAKVSSLWKDWSENYFLRYSRDEIHWQISNIDRHNRSGPLVTTRQQTGRGSTEIFIYTTDEPYLFGRIVSALARLSLDVVNARIITSPDGKTLDTFWVLDIDGSPITETTRLESIRDSLIKTLREPNATDASPASPAIARNLPRRLRHFQLEPSVEFDNEFAVDYTSLLITAIDTPGLLGAISQTLADHNIKIAAANIATFGEKAEDVFYVLDEDGNKLSDPAIAQQLQESLSELLSDRSGV